VLTQPKQRLAALTVVERGCAYRQLANQAMPEDGDLLAVILGCRIFQKGFFRGLVVRDAFMPACRPPCPITLGGSQPPARAGRAAPRFRRRDHAAACGSIKRRSALQQKRSHSIPRPTRAQRMRRAGASPARRRRASRAPRDGPSQQTILRVAPPRPSVSASPTAPSPSPPRPATGSSARAPAARRPVRIQRQRLPDRPCPVPAPTQPALLREMEADLARSVGDESMGALRRALVAILATLQPPSP
jgi:hypothetical protein